MDRPGWLAKEKGWPEAGLPSHFDTSEGGLETFQVSIGTARVEGSEPPLLAMQSACQGVAGDW